MNPRAVARSAMAALAAATIAAGVVAACDGGAQPPART